MSTIETRTYEINGVFDTGQTAINNLDTLCSAAGAWLTFDINTGKWSAIINRAGDSVASFNNSNILGSINVSGTGIDELYNGVKITFPNSDILDKMDVITLDTPDADRYPNEPDNVLEITYDCINDPMVAQMLAITNLRQSRADKIIEFRTDYSKLGLKAGDVIDVTAEMYAYDAKKFRVTKVSEEDGTDNNIILSITALEYDPGVYDYSDLTLYIRDRANGIIPKYANPEVLALDDISAAVQITSNAALSATNVRAAASTAALASTLSANSTITTLQVSASGFTGVSTISVLDAGNLLIFPFNPQRPSGFTGTPFKLIEFSCEVPTGSWNYTIGSDTQAVEGFIPTVWKLFYSATPISSPSTYNWNSATHLQIAVQLAGYQTPNINFKLPLGSAGYFYIVISKSNTYDLSTVPNPVTVDSINYLVANAIGYGITATGVYYG